MFLGEIDLGELVQDGSSDAVDRVPRPDRTRSVIRQQSTPATTISQWIPACLATGSQASVRSSSDVLPLRQSSTSMRPDGLAKDLGERPGTDRIRDLSNRSITDHHRVAAELDAEMVECTADLDRKSVV